MTPETRLRLLLHFDVWQTEQRLVKRSGLAFRTLTKTLQQMVDCGLVRMAVIQHNGKRMRMYCLND